MLNDKNLKAINFHKTLAQHYAARDCTAVQSIIVYKREADMTWRIERLEDEGVSSL